MRGGRCETRSVLLDAGGARGVLGQGWSYLGLRGRGVAGVVLLSVPSAMRSGAPAGRLTTRVRLAR